MRDAPVRVAHLVSHPIYYQTPLYRELASRPEIDLTVYFYSDASVRGYFDVQFRREVRWDAPLLEGYRSRFLPSSVHTRLQSHWGTPPNWDLLGELARADYDAFWIHGYAHLNAWVAAAIGAARQTRVLIREEQTLLPERPLYKRAVKAVALRSLFARSYGLYIGEENRRYFRHYGIPDERLFATRYCVENDVFRARARELEPQRERLRAQFGLAPEHPAILYVGKLYPVKAPLVLLEAFARVRERQPCSLMVVGEGPLRAAAEELIARRRIPDVHFVGFLNRSQIAEAYAAADVFCLPSLSETWGIVINEALNFELPVVVSDKVGCAPDLVHHGENGYVTRAGDAGSLAEALGSLVADEALRRRFGRQGRALVASYSIEACADGIVAACLAGA
jgi:glycosyltransferase involved in cell wall biosynthesis